MITAADEQDRAPSSPVEIRRNGTTRERVARLAAAGRRPSAIAAELGIAEATVSYHLQRLGAAGPPYAGGRAIVEMLGRSGVRVSELCDLLHREVRRTTPTAHTSGSPTPRPKPASARYR